MSHLNLRVAKTRYMTTMGRFARPVTVTAALRNELANTRKLMRAVARYAREFDARLAALASWSAGLDRPDPAPDAPQI